MKNSYARIGVVTAAVMALFAAPALAEVTTTILQGDGSALTVYDGIEHITQPGDPDPGDGQGAGGLTPIGPFTGDKSEGFFTQNPPDPFPPCVVDRVFDNTADLCSTGGCAHITDGWVFDCFIGPNNTPRLFGSCNGYAYYTFDQPVKAFGGYFTSNAPQPISAEARFFDADNNPIDQMGIEIIACQWAWSGWEAASAIISKVEIVGSAFGGAFIQMDDMEIAFGEPPVPVETASWGTIKSMYGAR